MDGHIIAIELIAYLFIGILAGFSAGLLGISGGLIVIPLLLLVFNHFGMPFEVIAHAAIATSLAAMIFNTLSSLYAHYLRDGVIWRIAFWMLPGLLFGAILGAFIADNLPSKFLRAFFGIFECALGVYIIQTAYRKFKRTKKIIPERWYFLSGLSFCISIVSAMFGIGGGPLTVPAIYYLLHRPLKKAIGTSAATGCFITFFGAIAYLFFGLQEVQHPNMVGYIYLPAFLVISITSLFFAPLGAHFAHRLPDKVLKSVFGMGLIILGIIVLSTTPH